MHYRKRLRQSHDTATEYYTNELYTTRFSANRALHFGNAGNQNLTLEINAQRLTDLLICMSLPKSLQLRPTLKNATHVTTLNNKQHWKANIVGCVTCVPTMLAFPLQMSLF